MDLKDKIPPHNLEAEQATLGAILLDWESVGQVVGILRSNSFYSQQNQLVFEAMMELYTKGIRGDTLTLIDELTRTGKLDAAGGASYISSLTDVVPTSANIEHYAQIVKDDSSRRDLLKLSSEVKAMCFDQTKQSRMILEDVEQKVFRLTDLDQTSSFVDMQEVMGKTIAEIDTHYKQNGDYTGIPSGFDDLDTMTSGFQNGEMIIVGARPSMGKTALALSMMQNIAIRKDIPCGFFSLEMSATQIGQRLLSQVSGVPGSKRRSGLLKTSDFKALQDAAGLCYSAPLYICDTPNMKLLDLLAIARRMKVNKGVKIIFIDYIGLITSDHDDVPVYEQQGAISKSLKSLARELDIPIVVLCQVQRDAEGNEPSLANLRGSGSIEQDADVVMFIHGERPHRKEGEPENPIWDRKLIVAKQRNGPIGDVDLLYISYCTRFESKARGES